MRQSQTPKNSLKTNAFPPILTAMGLLLLAASILLIWTQNDDTTVPSGNSTSPSGVRAFVELLQKDGYPVRVDASDSPNLKPGDLAIGYFISGFDNSGPAPASGSAVDRKLLSFADSGGTVLALGLTGNFRQASEWAQSMATVQSPFQPNRSYGISMSGVEPGVPLDFQASSSVSSWVTQGGIPAVAVHRVGKGYVVEVSDGIGTTNRFISEFQNAQFFLHLVQGLTPQGGSILFADATIGAGGGESLFQAIGHWALYARNQLVSAFLLGIYILGKRFGLPEKSRQREQGARELVDAMGDTMARAKQTQLSLQVLYDSADLQIRRSLRLPAAASVVERDRLLPPELTSALQESQALSHSRDKLSPSDATEAAIRLQTALDQWARAGKGSALL